MILTLTLFKPEGWGQIIPSGELIDFRNLFVALA